jgi:hypothetical protein
MAHNAAEDLVTGRSPTTLLAKRVMKARRSRACARCGVFVMIGERVGYVDQLGWCHLVPCITGLPVQARPA